MHPLKKTHVLIITLITFTLPSLSIQQTCLVDKCRVCANPTNITCTTCDTGYYLKTFDSGDKTYNACWSSSKLIWGLLTTILGSLLFCYLCKLCFDIGKKESLQQQKGGVNLKGPKQRNNEGSTLLSTQRSIPRSTQLVQQIPHQPLRPVPLPRAPTYTQPRSESPRITLNGQPYSFGQRNSSLSPRPVVRIPATNPNPQTQPTRVIPRVTNYVPQKQNLGNVKTANPTVKPGQSFSQRPSQPISRPRTFDVPPTRADDDDLGVNLTPVGIESQPTRLDQATRAVSPQEIAELKNPEVTKRVEPPQADNLKRLGDVQVGEAKNLPSRVDNSTNAMPIHAPVRGRYLQNQVEGVHSQYNPRVFRQRDSHRDIPFMRNTFQNTSPDLQPRRSRAVSQNRSVSPRPSNTIQQDEAFLDQRLTANLHQEMIEEPSSPARPFQGGGIASSLGPRRTSPKMPRN